ncbi:uncharacterized protein LOC119445556 [Dermacentor silvarum]|uniref:uncharacterized protein LOC119445556 n=1 Tax=Dermacentor silvarum TaxID=543639 RepID=UPI0021017A38|nr:uncharacterized protein LOC119445556 [Dermacentor silvarum]
MDLFTVKSGDKTWWYFIGAGRGGTAPRAAYKDKDSSSRGFTFCLVPAWFYELGVSSIPVALVPLHGGTIRLNNPKAVQAQLQAATHHYLHITDVRQFGRGSDVLASAVKLDEHSTNAHITCNSMQFGDRLRIEMAEKWPSGINYRGQRGRPMSSVLVTTWLLCWSFHGSEQSRRHLRRFVAGRSLTPLGWGEYCDGTRWAYKTPQCGNATKADTVDTKNEAGWPAFESACGSPSQSPININFLQTSFKSFGPISFLGYNVPFRFAIENGGHALYITPLYAHLESYGGPLPARYNLSKGIFHFGNETSPRGSEHTIDDRNFAAELQLLVSSEKPTPTECIRRGQGLAIFVILFEKQEQNNPFLDTLVNASEHMTFRGNKTEVMMPLAYLLPNTTQHYYIYLGSLSFPPCTSDAFVVVFRSTVAIGEQQASVYFTFCGAACTGGGHPVKTEEQPVHLHRRLQVQDRGKPAPAAAFGEPRRLSLVQIHPFRDQIDGIIGEATDNCSGGGIRTVHHWPRPGIGLESTERTCEKFN